jgi:hypothetical protein
MRAVADIQAEGLRAASELLERMLRSEPGGQADGAGSAAGDYAALVDAWTDLLRRTVSGLAGVADPGAVTVAVDAAGAGPPVRLALPASGGGDGVATEVWLHNGTASAVGPLALRCGPLSDAGGTVLDGAGVRFEPEHVDRLPARSSRAVAVSLAATPRPRAGTYRGAIQAQGAPALWLPLEVAVEPC